MTVQYLSLHPGIHLTENILVTNAKRITTTKYAYNTVMSCGQRLKV